MSNDITMIDTSSIDTQLTEFVEKHTSLGSLTYNASQKTYDDEEQVDELVTALIDLIVTKKQNYTMDTSTYNTHIERISQIDSSIDVTDQIRQAEDTTVSNHPRLPLNEWLEQNISNITKMQGRENIIYLFNLKDNPPNIPDDLSNKVIEYKGNNQGYLSMEQLTIDCQGLSETTIVKPDLPEKYADGENNPWQAWIVDFMIANQNQKQLIDSSEKLINTILSQQIYNVETIPQAHNRFTIYDESNNTYYIKSEQIQRIAQDIGITLEKTHNILSNVGLVQGSSTTHIQISDEDYTTRVWQLNTPDFEQLWKQYNNTNTMNIQDYKSPYNNSTKPLKTP